jgi:hypothetical protein
MATIMQHKLYAFLAVAILVGGIAWWSLSEAPADQSLLASESVSEQTGDRELVETLLQLRAVSLSGTILGDPAFQVLRDFGTQIIPEPIGRPNPFAPLSPFAATTSAQNVGPYTQGR